MRNVFLDTNILIDLLANRVPFSKFAIEIFDLGEKKQLQLYTSSYSYATMHYMLKKHITEKELRALLYTLLDFIKLIPIDISIIKKSLLSGHKDLEDAIQIFAANSIADMDCIITRNLKDFKDTGIPVLAPDEFIQHVKK